MKLFSIIPLFSLAAVAPVLLFTLSSKLSSKLSSNNVHAVSRELTNRRLTKGVKSTPSGSLAPKSSKSRTKFCWRDGITAMVNVDAEGNNSDRDSAAVFLDLGTSYVKDRDALLVEASVTHFFVQALSLDSSILSPSYGLYEYDNEIVAGMTAVAYKDCTSLADCNGAVPIFPFPNHRVPIKVEFDDWFVDETSFNEGDYDTKDTSTTTARFIWPAGVLDHGEYFLSLAFYLSSDVLSVNPNEITHNSTAALGPYLVTIETVEAESQECAVTVTDDDTTADIVWETPAP